MNEDASRRWVPQSDLPAAMVDLVPELAAALAALVDDERLVIATGSENRFVQYTVFDDECLRGETVGNHYLEPHAQMDAAALTWLERHGWNPPDESHNHWRHWEPTDPMLAAVTGLVTLHLIHGVTQLTYAAPEETIVPRRTGSWNGPAGPRRRNRESGPVSPAG